MPTAYSADIRGRVIASVESGSSRREAAEEFDVSASSAIKWVATYRTTGSCAAKPRGGSTSPLEKYANFLLTLIEGQLSSQPSKSRNSRRRGASSCKQRYLWRSFMSRPVVPPKRKPSLDLRWKISSRR